MMRFVLIAGALLLASAAATADNHAEAKLCTDFGPQTPRDISSTVGTNSVRFPVAPPANEMNL